MLFTQLAAAALREYSAESEKSRLLRAADSCLCPRERFPRASKRRMVASRDAQTRHASTPPHEVVGYGLLRTSVGACCLCANRAR